jgi:hypothetical protein
MIQAILFPEGHVEQQSGHSKRMARQFSAEVQLSLILSYQRQR